MTLSSDATDDSPIPPVRREVVVQAPPDLAFALFTAHLDRWWPIEGFSVFGAGAMVAFEDGRLVERLGDRSAVWGEVTTWDPPHSLTLAWYPGRTKDESTDLTITFEPLDEGSLVRLVHSGWERIDRGAGIAQGYGEGWVTVLALFVAGVAATIDHGFSVADAPEESQPETSAATGPAEGPTLGPSDTGAWYALVHTPGPALEDGASIFEHPMFAEHLAFLGRLRDRGLLVAAGPVAPERGEGMAVVHVLPEHGDVDVARLARTDDACVAGGYLQVEVRPWSVRLAAP